MGVPKEMEEGWKIDIKKSNPYFLSLSFFRPFHLIPPRDDKGILASIHASSSKTEKCKREGEAVRIFPAKDIPSPMSVYRYSRRTTRLPPIIWHGRTLLQYSMVLCPGEKERGGMCAEKRWEGGGKRLRVPEGRRESLSSSRSTLLAASAKA